jgi:hypothetical protein
MLKTLLAKIKEIFRAWEEMSESFDVVECARRHTNHYSRWGENPWQEKIH